MRFEPMILMDQTVCAKLNIDDLDIPNKENLGYLTQFQINTYVKLTKIRNTHKPTQPGDEPIADDNWNMTFATINNFINTLSKEHQTALAQGMMLMHHTILEFFNSNAELIKINETMRTVGSQLDAIDQEIDLLGQLRAYVDANIVVGLYEGAGKRAQDTDKLTFQPDQVRDLMTITLLCKMLCPIYGAIMTKLDKKIDTKMKETHCAAILTPMFNRRYGPLIEKLNYYITHTIKQRNEENASGMMHGYDNNSLAYHLYCILMVRQFVNVDLRVRDGNLMTYIIVSVKRAINTVKSTIKKNPLFARKIVTTKHDENGNTAQLEIDSMTSRKTQDVEQIIVAAVQPAIRNYMAKYQIDQDSYDESLAFYNNHPIIPNLINQDVNSMFFSEKLGGGSGLRILHAPEYTKITTLLQLIIFSLDSNYRDLGHMMTAYLATDASDTTMNANLFKIRAGSSVSYRNVRQTFENNPYGFTGKDWDNHTNKIAEHLTTNRYVYNTSNFLWNWLDEDNLNGKVFIPSETTITALCSLYELFMQTEGAL